MIGRLAGTLLEKNPPQITLDVAGVGYELDVPMSTFYNLPAAGERVVLHTHLAVREDAHQLFGFATEAERTAFRQLLKISGIGARTALALLSGLSVAELAQAVAAQEPGRLTLELRDRMKGIAAAAPAAAVSSSNDILNALLALGYNEREAQAALKALPAEVSVADGIRQALKSLSRA